MKQGDHARTRVLIASEQVRGQHGLGLRPAGHVRAPAALPGVVVGHTAFLTPVDLHVGGINIDRHRLTQDGPARRGQQVQHPLVHRGQPDLDRGPLGRADAPCQPTRRTGRQPRHRRQRLPRDIGPNPVQTDQELLPGQLRGRHPDQYTAQAVTPRPHLDRPHRGVDLGDHAQPVHQLVHNRPGQPSASTTDPARRPAPALPAASHHVSWQPRRCLPASANPRP